MTLNCELCQSEFSVLSRRIMIKLSKICFLCTYVDQMIIQQRLTFCPKFSFTIFLLMFFPLFSKVFTNILKTYELLKINTIPKFCQTLVLTIIIYQANSMSQLHLASKLTPINFIENVPSGAKDSFGTKFKKNPRWDIFFKKCSAKIVLLFCYIRCYPYSVQ